MNPCLICHEPQLKVFYEGPVRTGSFGKQSNFHATITECPRCGARHLPPMVADLAAYYQSGEYRNDLEQGNAVEKYFELTDDDQPHKLELLGMHEARGRMVADIGCGAGPFLDLVKGFAAGTIGVEPNAAYHESLRQRGHTCYPYARDALAEWQGKVDLAVSFSVLEHVEKPREFLAEIKALLKPGGRLLISTPNADDFLLEICPAYAPFFYRKAHLWYFTERALRELAIRAGFGECRVVHRHRYDLANALLWLRDRRPTGLGALKLDARLEAAWKSGLEAAGRGDYLYAFLS